MHLSRYSIILLIFVITSEDQTKNPSHWSPISSCSKGQHQSVVLNDAGVYPFYSDLHGVPYGMYGVIYVDHNHCMSGGK